MRENWGTVSVLGCTAYCGFKQDTADQPIQPNYKCNLSYCGQSTCDIFVDSMPQSTTMKLNIQDKIDFKTVYIADRSCATLQ